MNGAASQCSSLVTLSHYLIFPCGSWNPPIGNLAILSFPSSLGKPVNSICVVTAGKHDWIQASSWWFVKWEFIYGTGQILKNSENQLIPMENSYCWSDLIKLYNEDHWGRGQLKRLAFLGDSSGFVASTYRIIFKLQETQNDFGELCPTILSMSFIFFGNNYCILSHILN